MELIKLSERIYMLPFVRETDRPNLFYIKGDSYSVAVDAGNSAAHVREASGEDIAFCNECILMEYENLDEIKVVMADEVVQGEKTLDLGDVHLHLTARDSSHSRDALFVYVPEEKALILRRVKRRHWKS